MKPSTPTGHAELPLRNSFTSGLYRLTSDPAVICVLLALVTLVLYWPATGFQFVNDDDNDYYVKNSHVQAGLSWAGITWSFTTGTAANWHPLTWLSLMLDITLFGHSPEGPHLTNILIHAVNGALLFLVLRRLTGAHWRSAFVAGLFALHPLNVESVAWVSERKNVLSTFLWMLTLLGYVRYVEESKARSHGDKKYYGLSLLLFACGLMSKPMLVTLPFVLLLLDGWPLGRWRMDLFQDWRKRLPRLAVEKMPFFLLSVLSCIVTFLVQQHGNAVQTTGHYPIGGRIENAFVSYCRYLGKVIWPVNLTVFYQHPGHWPLILAVPAAALVLLICLLVVWQGRRFPFLVLGWFWFFGTLIPVIGLVQVGPQAMADRYAYVPLIGVFILISWGAAGIFARWQIPKAVIATVAVIFVSTCALVARTQLAYWQNDETLFQRAVTITPTYTTGHLTLARYLELHGRVEEAMEQYRTAIQLAPNNLPAHVNLGAMLVKSGRIAEAADEFQEAVRIDPQSPETHFNLGCILFRLGRRDEAIEQLQEALRLKPDFVLAQQALQTINGQ